MLLPPTHTYTHTLRHALQTHINDIMMKRYSKAKAAQEGGTDLAAGGARQCISPPFWEKVTKPCP